MKILHIPTELIKPAKCTVRMEFGDTDELANSIDKKGLLNPLTVRASKDEFEIVAGHRRFEALKKLGWKEIPCQIIDVPDKDAYETTLAENIQRRTLNPIEEAKAFTFYIQKKGWGGVTELAKKIGKSQPYISERTRLLKLPEEEQTIIARAMVPPKTAQIITTLPANEAAELVRASAKYRLTKREANDVKDQVKTGRSVQEAVEKTVSRRTLQTPIKNATSRIAPRISSAIKNIQKQDTYSEDPKKLVHETLAFLELVSRLIRQRRLYCPDHPDGTLSWSCCGNTLAETEEKLHTTAEVPSK